VWADLAAQADKEAWPEARFLAALAEHEMAGRTRRRSEMTRCARSRHACTRHVGRIIALSIEPFYNPSGRSSIGSRAAPISGNRYSDVVGYAHAVYEQIYYSSLMPRTYLCARLLETLD